MAAPNMVNVSTIYGKTAGLAVSTTATAIVTNAAGSGTVIKVNTLMIGNSNTVTAYKITADVYNGTSAFRFVPTVSIPANSGLDILAKVVYLEEGQSLRLTADANSVLEAIASYELIS